MKSVVLSIIGLFFLSTTTYAEDFRESLVSESVILKREFKVDIDECKRQSGDKVTGCRINFFPLDPIEAELNKSDILVSPKTIEIPVNGDGCKEKDYVAVSFYVHLNGYECGRDSRHYISGSCNYNRKSDEFYFREAALRLPGQKLTRYVISYKKK